MAEVVDYLLTDDTLLLRLVSDVLDVDLAFADEIIHLFRDTSVFRTTRLICSDACKASLLFRRAWIACMGVPPSKLDAVPWMRCWFESVGTFSAACENAVMDALMSGPVRACAGINARVRDAVEKAVRNVASYADELRRADRALLRDLVLDKLVDRYGLRNLRQTPAKEASMLDTYVDMVLEHELSRDDSNDKESKKSPKVSNDVTNPITGVVLTSASFDAASLARLTACTPCTDIDLARYVVCRDTHFFLHVKYVFEFDSTKLETEQILRGLGRFKESIHRALAPGWALSALPLAAVEAVVVQTESDYFRHFEDLVRATGLPVSLYALSKELDLTQLDSAQLGICEAQPNSIELCPAQSLLCQLASLHLWTRVRTAREDSRKGSVLQYFTFLARYVSKRRVLERKYTLDYTKERCVVVIENRRNVLSVLSVLVTLSNVVDGTWGLVVCCGAANEAYMRDSLEPFLAGQSDVIRFVRCDELDVEQFTPWDYTELLKSSGFWTRLRCETVLVVQDDGMLLRPGLESSSLFVEGDKAKYALVGAPWRPQDAAAMRPFVGDTQVGNGGFSLRNARVMASVAERFPVEKNHLYVNGYQTLPEDVFYAKCCLLDGHPPCPRDAAALFSSEMTLDHRSLGMHKVWPYHGAEAVQAFFESFLG